MNEQEAKRILLANPQALRYYEHLRFARWQREMFENMDLSEEEIERAMTPLMDVTRALERLDAFDVSSALKICVEHPDLKFPLKVDE